MRFKVDGSVKTADLMDMEESLSAGVRLMARCMVDDADQPVPEDQALGILREMSLDDLVPVRKDFLTRLGQMIRVKERSLRG